jgi:hypothetical protein
MKRRKCPNCGSEDLDLEEWWQGHKRGYRQTSAGIEPTFETKAGYPLRVRARCSTCRRSWFLRDIGGIAELRERYGEPAPSGEDVQALKAKIAEAIDRVYAQNPEYD